jgi:hypothetical protein
MIWGWGDEENGAFGKRVIGSIVVWFGRDWEFGR